MDNARKLAGSIVVLGWLLFLCGCSDARVEDGFVDPSKDLASINGSVSVGRDAHVGDLQSVNGSISVGENSQVGDVSNVNGATRMDPGARANGIQSVNGSIVAEGITVYGEVRSINGGIRMGEGSSVGGDVRSVNGSMRLWDTAVEGTLINYNGNIELYPGTRVKGGIRVEDSFDLELGKLKVNVSRPDIILHADTAVDGQLVFKRDVHLWVHETAEIGEVSGAEVRRFSGDSPPRT